MLEKRVHARSIGYEDFSASKKTLLANAREQLRGLAGEQALPYIGFGYELGSLLLLLRNWDQLQGIGNLISTVKEHLQSIQMDTEKITLPDSISVELLTMRAEDLARREKREDAQRVLDDTLNYFDLDALSQTRKREGVYG